MDSGDSLLEDSRVPWKVNIDDRIGGLEVEAYTTCIGGDEESAIGVLLELPDQSLSFFLRDRTIQADKIESPLPEQRLNQVEHRRPFRKENDLAVFLFDELIEKIFKFDKLAGVAGRDFVDEKGAIGYHPAEQQGLLESQNIYLGDISF